MSRKITLRIVGFFVVCATLLSMLGCAFAAEEEEYITSVEQINGKRFGVVTGTIMDAVCKEKFPECEILYYNNISDEAAALLGGKIDCFLVVNLQLDTLLQETEGLTYLEQAVSTQDIAALFAKDSEYADKIRAEFDEFLNKSDSDGTLKKLENEWMENYNSLTIDRSNFTGENGVLTLATGCDTMPFTFLKDGEPAGFEVDLFYRFCKEYGYMPEVSIMNFGALIPSVVSGKSDMAMDAFAVTEERSKSVNFSRPHAVSSQLPIVRAKPVVKGFWESITDSFSKTFVVENRWQLILSGVGRTLLITVVSAVAGSIIGFLIYILCRKSNKFVPSVFNGLAWVVSGLPAVVLLMIMYYVIFGNSRIDGLWVSMVAFTITVSLSVYSSLSVAVLSIDKGQLEGAYSLGVTDTQAFLRIIFPQAMTQFMPNYRAMLVSLVQATAIVGYIAVEDLTKVSDIIRSRTYEAFFPLIASAVIYLFLGWVLTRCIRRFEIKINPQRRSVQKILRRYEK